MLLAGLLACSGAPDVDGPPDPCADAPTWDDFADGYVHTWCTSCHSASLSGPDRQGAPAGFDLDSWSQVSAARSLVEQMATGPDPSMPPLGGVPEEDVARFAEWLACGAPGADDPPGPCDVLSLGPAATVGDAADADALCAAGNAVAALTVTGTVEIPCLCAVEGDVVVSGEVDLPLLERIDGDLRGSGTLTVIRAPELAAVGGDLVLVGDPVLEVELTALATVGGGVVLTDLPALRALSLDALYAVTGELTVARAPLLASLDLPRLRTTGGAFVVEDQPALVELLGTRSLEAIGGDLRLTGLEVLPVLDDFAFMRIETVGGDLVIARDQALAAVHGFALLADVGGDVLLEELPSLVRVEGFDNLVHVGGDVTLRQNARQESVNGFIALEVVDGALVLEDLPELGGLPGLAESLATVGGLRLARLGATALPEFSGLTAAGELRIEEIPLTRLEGFPAIAAIATLTITSNASLAELAGFAGLASLGDVTVTDNPQLSQAAVEAWLATLTVSGSVTLSGNAP